MGLLVALEAEPVYVALCKASVVTGMRQGELIGANLEDVDLLNGVIRVERHYDRESGTLTLPKDGEKRTVYLIPPAKALLEEWIALQGDRARLRAALPGAEGRTGERSVLDASSS